MPDPALTLAQFRLGTSLGYPTTYASNGDPHRDDLIEIRLDRSLLVQTATLAGSTYTQGSISTLRFVSDEPPAANLPIHYTPPFHLQDVTGIARTADRGTYNVLDVTITDASTGQKAVYGAAELAALGFATSFAVRGTTAPTDLFWRGPDGTTRDWLASTASGSLQFRPGGGYNGLSASADWTAVEHLRIADGDGILWRNADGRVSLWYGSDPRTGGPLFLDHGPVGAEWSIAATGDIDADGAGEILWRRSDGALSTWSATGGRGSWSYDGTRNIFTPDGAFAENSWFHASVGRDWLVEGLSDFSGDNRSDILWRNTDGSLSIWKAADAGGAIAFAENSWYHGPVALSWHVAGLGDFDGDGRDDILWRNDNGAVSVWTSTGTGFTEGRMNATAATDWQVAQVADFDNDGRSDILWRNAAGAVSVWQSTGSGWNQNVFYDAGPGRDWTLAAHHFVL